MTEWWNSIVWGSPAWQLPAAGAAALAALVLTASYLRTSGPPRVRLAAAVLKGLALAALLVCLLEPMRRIETPRPGANLFLVLADNSRSVTLQDTAARSVRQQIERALGDERWQTRLAQDFDVRRYAFDSRLRAAPKWEALDFDGQRSSLGASLETIHRRFAGQPVAGVLLLSDGNSTDSLAILEQLAQPAEPDDQAEPDDKLGQRRGVLPPIYPVVFSQQQPAPDVAIERVTVRQTNFEDSPVTISADVTASGFPADTAFEVQLIDADNQLIDRTAAKPAEGGAVAVELRARPEAAGLHVYRLKVVPQGPEGEGDQVTEATVANNQRLALVERGAGPYRVLYVAGRPNWEFKFLRRAVEEDTEMDLVGMLRIARKEPKFVFRDRGAGRENPLFQGFEGKDADDTEEYDQPVMLRIGVEDAEELRDGFPRDAETLFDFHAVILDDLESRFFDQDQLSLIQEFVSQRGGGLLMLGGPGSFASGGYDRTPLGDMLPVYVDERPPSEAEGRYQLQLSREGWLQPWVRMRTNEADEQRRLIEMPPFETVNWTRRIKPGATIVASARLSGPVAGLAPDGQLPALVEQRYGRGRAGALLIGDYWKWAMRREETGERDLEKAWRQMLRWLISDVPGRVEAAAIAPPGAGEATLRVEVRDAQHRPLDNVEVQLQVATPDGRRMRLRAAAADQAGVYAARFAHREPGAYLVTASATAADGSEIGECQTGWTHEPDADEFQSLSINRPVLQRLADLTGGELIDHRALGRAAASFTQRRAVVNETRMIPLWHRWYVFLLAACCLAAEWGLRRWHGMP